ncbi:MAG: hypothetical protein IK139_08205 [Lachnospiraceae bacterium]|nr:hypothetical protein [Lachnospiraceae bacterium]
MSCIVYQTDKKTGIKYAYESFSYWDKEKKQPRSKRKYLGPVDPDTNEILYKDDEPKRKTGRGSADSTKTEELKKEIAERDRIIKNLKEELKKKDAECRKLAASIEKARNILNSSASAE